ncbi:heavy metal-associated isoprenylated plant protein 28 [Elaeis guineensis]|uniref:Heavy metal-associated isoprenylated plant protein 28 n=1 Tax=Elaeis guineensis var. tenera TaxID=51953 RepID=A0A6I9R3Q8_ELAGV|nr:heavy metal-associated isoprenylated plant protein 28 [Elaeis guineensis]
MTIVEMCVHMDCSGCESKIRKALQKLKGVDNVDIDMGRQKVTVTGWVDQKKVLKAVRKTGRRAVLWPYPYGAENHTFTIQQYYHQQHPALATGPVSVTAAPSSSYNYYKHGYDDSRMHGSYHPSAHSAVVNERAGDIFSVENPNNCSIM